jgi:hypothetical protein
MHYEHSKNWMVVTSPKNWTWFFEIKIMAGLMGLEPMTSGYLPILICPEASALSILGNKPYTRIELSK